MEDTSNRELFMSNMTTMKNARFVDIPALDKEMLSTQSTIIGNTDKQFSMPSAFNSREDTLTNLPSPDSGGILTAENSPTYHAFIQSTNRPLAMAVAKMEQSYMQTRLALQKSSRNVLLGVLLSLIDEHPTSFVEPVRVRLEQLALSRGGMPASGGSGTTAPSLGGGAMLWPAPGLQAGGGASAGSTAFAVPSPPHRKSRAHRNRDDEQELCSVHHCMRVLKHLQLNHATGLYECVHGFHCLVDGPVEGATNPGGATTNSSTTGGKQTPTSDTLTQGSPYHGFNGGTPKEPTLEGGNGGGGHPFGSPLMKHFPTTGGGGSQILMNDRTGGGYLVEEDPALDVYSLTNLLKSVRAMEKEE